MNENMVEKMNNYDFDEKNGVSLSESYYFNKDDKEIQKWFPEQLSSIISSVRNESNQKTSLTNL